MNIVLVATFLGAMYSPPQSRHPIAGVIAMVLIPTILTFSLRGVFWWRGWRRPLLASACFCFGGAAAVFGTIAWIITRASH